MTDDEKRLPQPADETVEQMEREGFMPPPPLRDDTGTGFAVGDEAHVWTPETIEQAFSPPRDLRPTRDKIDEIAADLAVTYRATFEFPPDTPPVTLYWSDDHEDADRRLPDAYERLMRDGGWVVLNDQVVGRIEPGTQVEVRPPVEPEPTLWQEIKELADEWGTEGPSLVRAAHSGRDVHEGIQLEECAKALRAILDRHDDE